MKVQLNADEKLTVVTPFGEIELSVSQFGATLMYQDDNLKDTGSAGTVIENDKGERIWLNVVKEDSSYKKYQIARPIENDLNDPMDLTTDQKYIFFLNESMGVRSEKIPAEWFIEYCGIDEIEEIRDLDYFNDYRLLEEYLFENDIKFNLSLKDSEEYRKVTNLK